MIFRKNLRIGKALPYADFPWFRKATLDQILQVELLQEGHIRWPAGTPELVE
jgi:hypothetical protein